MSATLKLADIDQYGQFTSPSLAPGKHLVLATTTPIDQTQETIEKLWNGRNRLAREVDVAAGTTSNLVLQPVALDYP